MYGAVRFLRRGSRASSVDEFGNSDGSRGTSSAWSADPASDHSDAEKLKKYNDSATNEYSPSVDQECQSMRNTIYHAPHTWPASMAASEIPRE